MTPIVFWASCRPCPSAIAAADSDCASRKPRVVLPGLLRRKIHRIAVISRNAPRNPIAGDSTIGMTTLSTMPDHSTTLVEARPAPTRPPISACEDELTADRSTR